MELAEAQNFISIGIISLLLLSGVMGIVFIHYVKNIMRDLDKVALVPPLIEKMAELVEKVDRVVTTLAVTKETHRLEIDNLKTQVQDIFSRLNELEKRCNK